MINRRVVDDYVRSPDEFSFLAGVPTALARLADWAPRMVVVTNQQGIGRGLVTADVVDDIHDTMRQQIEAAGGRIDDVLVCPHVVSQDCLCRKPRPGLAAGWLERHPEVVPALSVMVGDSASDIEMGRALSARTGGCVTIRIGASDTRADLSVPSLAALASAIE